MIVEMLHRLALRLTRLLAGWLTRHPLPGASRIIRNLHLLVPGRQPGSRTTRTGSGFLLRVDPFGHKGPERVIYTNGSYEVGTQALIETLLSQGGTFVDVGANVGLMTIHAARKVGDQGRVLAFEPAPDTLDVLRTNLALNDIRNVHTFGIALGSRAGTALLQEPLGTNRGSRSLHAQVKSCVEYAVVVEPLIDVLNREQIDHVDLVKIDVEGWETEVLLGATPLLTRRPSPALIVESVDNVNENGRKETFDMLTRYGYRLFYLKHGKECLSVLREIVSAEFMPRHDNIVALHPEHEILLKNDGWMKD